MIRVAFQRGGRDALRKFAGPQGLTHGTNRNYYPAVDRPQQDPDETDELWNRISDPEQTSGEGEEVIG